MRLLGVGSHPGGQGLRQVSGTDVCLSLLVISVLHLETEALSPQPTSQPCDFEQPPLGLLLHFGNVEVAPTFPSAGTRIKSATGM